MAYQKPARVRFYSTAPYADDVQLNRIQSLGSSSQLNQTDVEELANMNIIEFVDELPAVQLTVDANENGTMDIVSLFANQSYGGAVLAVPSGAGINAVAGTAAFAVNPASIYVNGVRVPYSGTTSMAVPSGNTYYTVSLIPTGNAAGQPDFTLTLTQGASGATTPPAAPAGALTLATFSVGADSAVYQNNITDARSWNSLVIEDYEYAEADFYVPVKPPYDSNIQRTMYMEAVFLDNISLNFQTQGLATANYTLETDNKKWFLQNSANIMLDRFYVATAGTTTYTLSETPTKRPNGNYTLKVMYGTNGAATQLVEGTDFTVSGSTVTLVSPMPSVGTAPAVGDIFSVRYTTPNGANFFTMVPNPPVAHPTPAAGLQEGMIEVYLSDDSQNNVLRLQSVQISAQLTRDVLQQLGNFRAYNRPLQLPVDITINVQALDSDLDLWARFNGVPYTPTKGYEEIINELDLENLLKNMGITVKIYRETDVVRSRLPVNHPLTFPLKTVYINEIVPTDEQWNVQVGSDATQTLNFRAFNLTFTGVTV